MWWPFKRNKFKNIVREDLVNSICELERQERTAEAEIMQKQKEIDALLEKGKKEKGKSAVHDGWDVLLGVHAAVMRAERCG